MSWNISASITKINREQEVEALQASRILSAHESDQLAAAKDAVLILLESLDGDEFRVSMVGHSQVDTPDSLPDQINVSIYVKQ